MLNMARKPKKTKREPAAWSKHWKTKADKEVTKYFKRQACAICGSLDRVCGHHILPRSRSAHHRHTFWNIIPLCPSCHSFSRYMAAHSNSALGTARFTDWLKNEQSYRWRMAQDHEFDDVRKCGKVNYKEAYNWWAALNAEEKIFQDDYEYTCHRLGIRNDPQGTVSEVQEEIPADTGGGDPGDAESKPEPTGRKHCRGWADCVYPRPDPD